MLIIFFSLPLLLGRKRRSSQIRNGELRELWKVWHKKCQIPRSRFLADLSRARTAHQVSPPMPPRQREPSRRLSFASVGTLRITCITHQHNILMPSMASACIVWSSSERLVIIYRLGGGVGCLWLCHDKIYLTPLISKQLAVNFVYSHPHTLLAATEPPPLRSSCNSPTLPPPVINSDWFLICVRIALSKILLVS